jgi:hypothetical protein
MKRLIKAFRSSSNHPVVKFVENWFHNHSSMQRNYSFVEQIAAENSDCMFSGTAFRFIELEEPYEVDNQEKLIEYAYSAIEPIEDISSFSASKAGVEYFTQTEYPSFGVIISASTNGIYLPNLVQKYQNDIDQSSEIDGRIIDSITHEDEVIVIEPIGNFEIVALIVEHEINWLK